MTRYLGMLRPMQLMICNSLLIAALLLFIGCSAFGPTKTPEIRGVWSGQIVPVSVIGANDISHLVAGFKISKTQEYVTHVPGANPPPSNGEQIFWSYWDDDPIPLLINTNGQLILYADIGESFDRVELSGKLKYSENNPSINDVSVIRESRAALIANKDTPISLVYTSGAELILELDEGSPGSGLGGHWGRPLGSELQTPLTRGRPLGAATGVGAPNSIDEGPEKGTTLPCRKRRFRPFG